MLLTRLFFEKGIIFALVAAIAVFVSYPVMFLLLIILGYGHFIAARLYQWKAGKFTPLYLSCVALIFVGAYVFITKTANPQLIVLGVVIFFASHHFMDELRFFNLQLSAKYLSSVLFPVCAYVTLGVHALFPGFDAALLATGVILLAGFPLRNLFFTTTPNERAFYLYSVTTGAAFLAIIFLHLPLHINYVLSTIVLFHYFAWYIYYYHRLSSKPQMLKTYLTEMVSITAGVCVVYGIFLISGGSPYLQLRLGALFAAPLFYMFTTTHILSSFVQYLMPSRPKVG